VPVETAADVATYLAKVELYELAPAGRASYPLLISDIASSVPVLGDIDGAEGLEPIVSALWPQPLKSHALRLYATQAAATKYGGQLFSEAAATSAFNAGYLLGLHSGHGSYDWFTDALDMTWVEGLQNALPPVFLTCACLAGNFADVATTETYDGWRLQGPGEDSVAERFILQPHGGVAYVGNTGVGLGPIGGSQFLYGVFDGLFKQGLPRLGDAVNHGHATMRSVALTMEYVPMSMTDASEWWTHMITILLGDPAIEVWAAEPAAAALTAPATYGPGWQQLTVTATAGGAPLAGAVVTAVKAGDFVLRATTDAAGSATFTIVPRGPAPIELGVSAPGVIGARATISPQG
jgi:hypothetical protein